MLAKCANPGCSATFRYFHEGRLFAIESRVDSPRRGPPADPEYTSSPPSLQYFWLCSSCCRAMTVQSDGDRGVTIMNKQGRPGNVFRDRRSHSDGGVSAFVPGCYLAVWEVCVRNAGTTVQALRNELQFVQKGGYRAPLVWRSPLIFEDSPTCPKEGCSACPDADCVLMSFVPKECRHEPVLCRHIPLNEIGETLDSLYRTGTSEEIEQTLESWLLKTIGQFEEPADPRWLEKAA